MQQTRILMGMPVTVDVVGKFVTEEPLDLVYSYFEYVDEKFSTYKDASEISLINVKQLSLEQASDDMRTVFQLAERTRHETFGYFDITRSDGTYDPSGLVKGWAIYNAALLLRERGYQNFYVDAGGDIQTWGLTEDDQPWRVGIRNPFNMAEIVKAVAVGSQGVATSGTYARGQHIYRPNHADEPIEDIVSLTVIGPNIYEADRFATAAFAMGRAGITFIESLEGLEGYQIDSSGIATYTSGFEEYVCHD